jgi:glycosyltransferase involved in cell wall biosynthesis
MLAVRSPERAVCAFVPAPGAVSRSLEQAHVETTVLRMPSLRGAGWLRWPRTVRIWSKAFARQGLSLVHANGARCMLYAGAAARRDHITCIWHVRVLERDPLLDRLRARMATGIIANSNVVAETLRPLMAEHNHLRVIYNAVPEMHPAKALSAPMLHEIPDIPVLLVLGRVTPEKGIEDLIEAAALLKKRGCRHTVCIAGATPDAHYLARLRKRIRQHGLDNIQFPGHQDDVAQWLCEASLLVLPSRREAFGRVIIEAWQYGIPVVAADQGGPAELIRHAEDGWLVPVRNPAALADVLEMLINHPQKRAALARAGRLRAKEFTLPTLMEQVVAFYHELGV